MTELETMQREKMYLDKLAQGIDPITGAEVPEDSVLNNVRLARCFFYVSGVLQRVIDNGGMVSAVNAAKPAFSITAQQLAGVMLPGYPLRITEFADLLLSATNNPGMKRPSPTAMTNWLLEQGLLEKVKRADGKLHRVPTEAGRQIGMFTEIRQSQYGEYEAVFYSSEAQKYLLEHLAEIFEITGQ